MRPAVFLIFVAACAGAAPHGVGSIESIPEVGAMHPDVAFRWSLAPLPCDRERSSADRCSGADGAPFVVAAYVPGADDPRVPIVRYDGDHAGAPKRWLKLVDLGPGAHDPVVGLAGGTVAVAAIARGALRIALVDVADGRTLATRTLVEHGARGVQLELERRWVVAHVRLDNGGGYVALVDPEDGRVITGRAIAARSIRDTIAPDRGEAMAFQDTREFSFGWDGSGLVARRSGRWATRGFVAIERPTTTVVTLDVAGNRVLTTLHDATIRKHDAIALDARTGARLWISHLGFSFPDAAARPSAFVDGDELVVQLDGRIPNVCSIAIRDGIQRACVEHPPKFPEPERTFDFPDDVITP